MVRRMIRRIALGLTLACSVLGPTACASKDPAAPAPVKKGPELRFETTKYTLDAGQEKYFCYTMTLPADHDTVITSYTPEYGNGVHHFAFFYTLTAEPDGFSECPVLI